MFVVICHLFESLLFRSLCIFSNKVTDQAAVTPRTPVTVAIAANPSADFFLFSFICLSSLAAKHLTTSFHTQEDRFDYAYAGVVSSPSSVVVEALASLPFTFSPTAAVDCFIVSTPLDILAAVVGATCFASSDIIFTT